METSTSPDIVYVFGMWWFQSLIKKACPELTIVVFGGSEQTAFTKQQNLLLTWL